jgi:hypothetical protein
MITIAVLAAIVKPWINNGLNSARRSGFSKRGLAKIKAPVQEARMRLTVYANYSTSHSLWSLRPVRANARVGERTYSTDFRPQIFEPSSLLEVDRDGIRPPFFILHPRRPPSYCLHVPQHEYHSSSPSESVNAK